MIKFLKETLFLVAIEAVLCLLVFFKLVNQPTIVDLCQLMTTNVIGTFALDSLIVIAVHVGIASRSNISKATVNSAVSKLAIADTTKPYLTNVDWSSLNIAVYADFKNQYYKDLLVKSLHAWNNAGVAAFYITDDCSQANIVVKLQKHIGASDIGQIAAQTVFCDKNSNVINKQLIVRIDTGVVSNDANPTTNLAVVEHEFGHVLGLNHRSNDDSSVMYPIPTHEISPVDVQAVKNLYHLN